MALLFKSKAIPGSHGPIIVGSPELHARRVKYWEVQGEGEVIGESGGRSLSVEITLHDQYTGNTPAKLFKYLDKLDALVGQHGTLTETPDDNGGLIGVSQDFKNCTFEGREPAALPGQVAPGPLKDVAGTLVDDAGTPDLGWFITVILHFRQLLVK